TWSRISADLLRAGCSRGRGRQVVDKLVNRSLDVGGRDEAVRRDVDVARRVAPCGTGEVVRELGVDLVERRLHGVDRGLQRAPAAADDLDCVALGEDECLPAGGVDVRSEDLRL